VKYIKTVLQNKLQDLKALKYGDRVMAINASSVSGIDGAYSIELTMPAELLHFYGNKEIQIASAVYMNLSNVLSYKRNVK